MHHKREHSFDKYTHVANIKTNVITEIQILETNLACSVHIKIQGAASWLKYNFITE